MERKISIIIPVKNENKYVLKCLASVFDQEGIFADYDAEVLIIDSLSNDGSVNEIRKCYGGRVKIIQNLKQTTAAAFNLGIKDSRGGVIFIVSAHSRLAKDYLKTCLHVLAETGADCVGGAMRPISESLFGKAIVGAHYSIFGLGGGKFHDPEYSGYVDTVYMGVYRREAFNKAGWFDEALVRNQDIEFNSRLRRAGGKIFLSDQIVSSYYCRSDLYDLWKQNYANGYWNVITIKKSPGSLSLRHFVPLLFVVTLGLALVLALFHKIGFYLVSAILLSYTFLAVIFTLQQIPRIGLAASLLLPVVFAVLHISYGMGSVWALTSLSFGWEKDVLDIRKREIVA